MNEEQSNLEVKIARLETKVDFVLTAMDALTKGMKDLGDNFSTRLDRVEGNKFPSSDFIQFRNNEFVPLSQDVKTLMQYRWILAGIVTAAMFLSPFIWQLINKHL